MSKNTSEQKTEKPTPKRLRDARKKGQVAFSRDANGVAVFIVAIFVIFASAGPIASGFEKLFEQARTLAALDQVGPSTIHAASREALALLIRLLLPLMLACAVIGAGLGLLQTRFVFSFHPLKPKISNLSPMKRLKQWFSVDGLFEYAKTWVKLLTVIVVAWAVIGTGLGFVLKLGFADTGEIAVVLAMLVKRFLVWAALVFLALGALDFLFQRWKWMRDLKMGRHELRQEYKQTEGDPLIKSRRKAVHREMSLADVEQAVAQAQVVLVNPTHLAIALHYDLDHMPAPRVGTKGRSHVAQRIVNWAAEYDKPVIRNVPLAWALIDVEVGGLVPRDLYVAVAEVLNSVEQMRQRAGAAAAAGGA